MKDIERLRKYMELAGIATPVEALALSLGDRVRQLEAENEQLKAERDVIRELRIQMLACKTELINDDSKVAKVFAGRITEWTNILKQIEGGD